jgi:hypothetical protein
VTATESRAGAGRWRDSARSDSLSRAADGGGTSYVVESSRCTVPGENAGTHTET